MFRHVVYLGNYGRQCVVTSVVNSLPEVFFCHLFWIAVRKSRFAVENRKTMKVAKGIGVDLWRIS